MSGIVYVTKPRTDDKIQFAFDLLDDQGMNPYWLRHQPPDKQVVMRPALPDDPPMIVVQCDAPEESTS